MSHAIAPGTSEEAGSRIWKILLVDDDPRYLEYLQRVFARSGFKSKYEVDSEADARRAMRELQSNDYDLCLLDYHLGKGTGLELVGQCKKNGCRTAFIILTASDDEKVADEALFAGVDDYLIKGQVDPSALDRSIRYALQRRQVEKMTTEQQLKLGHAIQLSALGELAASIIHEINNPLVVIRGSSLLAKTMLEKEDADIGEAIQKLQTIDQCTDRIAKIIRSLKSFSFNEGSVEARPTPFRDIVDKTVAMCQGRLKAGNISFHCELPDQPLAIECRENEIIQVLVNLINNSCDALEKSGSAWIKIEAFEKEGKTVVFFTDSGGGIPPALRDKILQPYFTTKPKGKGTGLGLSICRTIIENHGGRFSIDYGCKNTRFVLELPCRQRGAPAGKRPFAILVAEDDADIRSLIEEQVRFEAARVLVAADGDEALKTLLEEDIDLLIADVNMPGLSGIQLIERLRSEGNRRVPHVAFVTGEPAELFTLKGGHASCTMFPKPVDFAALRSLIRQLMKQGEP